MRLLLVALVAAAYPLIYVLDRWERWRTGRIHRNRSWEWYR